MLTPTSGDAPALRVPFVEVVRGVSKISTTPIVVTAADVVELTSTNAAGATGTLDVYAWGLTDLKGDALTTDVRAVGVQSFPDSDFGVFSIQTFGAVSNPAVNEWDVLLDTTGDGDADYAVIGYDLGAFTAGEFNGTLASITDRPGHGRRHQRLPGGWRAQQLGRAPAIPALRRRARSRRRRGVLLPGGRVLAGGRSATISSTGSPASTPSPSRWRRAASPSWLPGSRSTGRRRSTATSLPRPRSRDGWWCTPRTAPVRGRRI